ncbi:MAG: transposase [Candidatus Cloacimonetes bacterium]|nr:transposase [Candidatus Cloacimonadota bacterium]
MDDHIHLLIGLNPTIAISTFVQKVKTNSSRFMNNRAWVTRKFEWQEGYGAFSVSKSKRNQVREYIRNQVEHHQRYSFIDEYKGLLTKHKIDYDERYLFEQCKC